MLVFYPFAFSPVCTDQLVGLQRAARGLQRTRRDALRRVVRRDVLADGVPAAARDRRSSSCRTSSPRARPAAAFGVLHEGGFPQRALVLIDPDGIVRWSHEAASPGDLPGANLIFDALDADAAPSSHPDRPAVGAAVRPRLRPAGPAWARPIMCAGRGAAGRGLRRLRVPVLRGARRRAGRAGRARVLPPLPGALLASAGVAGGLRRRGGRASRARSGRCTTRCSPTRAGSRIRTCGPGPSRSGSTWTRFDADRRSPDVLARIKSSFRGGRPLRRRHHADRLPRRRACTRRTVLDAFLIVTVTL